MKKQNKATWSTLLQAGLFVGFIVVALGITFRSSSVFSLSSGSQNLNSIKTALAGTAQALLGPFPTQTMPTKTVTPTATNTPLVSATPTFTPSKTFTPVPTHTVLSGTATQQERDRLTQVAEATLTQTKLPTKVPTRTPTRIATRTPTRPPNTPTKLPTVVVTQTTPTRGQPPTPTNTPKPPKPTNTPQPPPSTPTNPPPPTEVTPYP